MTVRDDFAAALKSARLAAGLSQADLGAKAGLTGSYICVLEARRKPPPSGELVTALARALEIDEGKLQELAALERTPEPVRQRVLRLVKERGRSRRSRDSLLASTLFHMTRRPGFLADAVADALGLPDDRRLLLGRLAERVRHVPTADEASTRSGDILKEVPGRERDALVRALPRLLGGGPGIHEPPPSAHGGGAAPALAAAALSPPPADERPWQRVPLLASPPVDGDVATAARGALDTFHVDRRLWREGAYLYEAVDDDAWPRVEKGDLLLVHPSTAPDDGALVLVRDAGHVRARILRRQGADVRLESPRTDVPPLRLPAARFAPLGVVVWVLRPLDGLPARRRPHEPGS